MTLYLGDYAVNGKVYVPFHTFASTGASVTITGLAVTDIEIYRDGSATQRASDAGYALLDTDGIDFDGITGVHGFSIDLSDNTDAGFYAAGHEYWVVVASITVDAQVVNFVAATFSIERAGGALAFLKAYHPAATPGGVGGVPTVDASNYVAGVLALGTQAKADVNAEADTALSDDTRLALLNALALNRTTIATLASQTSFTLTAGSADNSAYKDCIAVFQDASTATQKAIGIIGAYVGASKTVTLRADPGIFTMAPTDIVTILPPAGAFLQGILGTALPAESVAGYDAAALGKFLDVATPLLTVAAPMTPAGPNASTIAGAVLDEAKGVHSGHIASIPTNPYTGTPPTADAIGTDAAAKVLATPANKLVTDTSGRVTAGTVSDKTAYKLASDGLDSVSTAAPTGVASNFREMVVALFRRFYGKVTMTTTALKTYDDAGTGIITTQAVSDDGTTQTQGKAS
jgi:hypothetical protein